MTDRERAAAIRAHGAAHEAKIVKRRKARTAADERKKKRGLAAAVARLK
jgi:hypothetical protein